MKHKRCVNYAYNLPGCKSGKDDDLYDNTYYGCLDIVIIKQELFFVLFFTNDLRNTNARVHVRMCGLTRDFAGSGTDRRRLEGVD